MNAQRNASALSTVAWTLDRWANSGFQRVLAVVFFGGVLILSSTAYGQIFVTNNSTLVNQVETGSVGKYTLSGTPINTALISTGLPDFDPYGIAALGTDLFVTKNNSGTIGEFTTSGATVNGSLVTGLTHPAGIVVSSGSYLFVANATLGTIGEYTITGGTINASLITGLSGPTDLALAGGDLYIANGNNGTVSEYTTSGTKINSSLLTGLGPGQVAIAASSTNLFITSNNDGDGLTLGEYTLTGSTVHQFLITGLHDASAVALAGSDLFIVDNINDNVSEYTTSGTPVATPLFGGLGYPYGIAVEVPEPSSVSLLALASACLLVRRRRIAVGR